PRRMGHAFALGRDVAGHQEHQPAQRIDLVVLGGEAWIDRLLQLVELEPGVGFPQAVVEHGQHAGAVVDVVLVLDVADDLLDHVPAPFPDRHQALGPAELVDDDGEVDAFAAHPRQQFDHAHRFGDEQRIAYQRPDRAVAVFLDLGLEHVLDVDHADYRIEAFA